MNYYDNPYPNNPNFWQGETGKPYDSEAGSKMSDVRENSKKKETLYQGKAGNTPVIPLPNPGEGGPVYNGGAQNTPVIPLPNPGGAVRCMTERQKIRRLSHCQIRVRGVRFIRDQLLQSQ